MGSRDIKFQRHDVPQYVFDGCKDEKEYEAKVVALAYDKLDESRNKWRERKRKWHDCTRRMENYQQDPTIQAIAKRFNLPLLPQAIEEKVALGVENLPKPEPKSRTPAQEKFAGALGYFMEQELDNNRFPIVMAKTILNQAQMFIGIIKCVWDENLPSKFPGEKGAISLRNIDPRYFWPDPFAKGTRWEDARYWIFAEPEDLTAIGARFRQRGNRVRAESEYCLTRAEESEYEEAGDEKIGKRDRALLIEFWLKDDRLHFVPELDEEGEEQYYDDGTCIGEWVKRYPHGRLIVVANKVMLFDGPNPFDHGRPPYVLFTSRVSNDILSWSDIELLGPIEDVMSKLARHMTINAEFNMNSPWLADDNAFAEPKKYHMLSNKPGLVVRKRPGSEVLRMPPAELPQFIMPLLAWLRSIFDEILGIQAVMRGQLEKGSQLSADAVEKLQVTSTSRIRWRNRLMEESIKELGFVLAWTIRQFYPSNLEIEDNDPRTGEARKYQWTPEAAKADYAIQMQSGSGLPGSKEGGFTLYMKLWQLGLISRLRTLQALNVPDAEAADKEMKEEEKRMALLGQLAKQRGNKTGSAGRKELGG